MHAPGSMATLLGPVITSGQARENTSLPAADIEAYEKDHALGVAEGNHETPVHDDVTTSGAQPCIAATLATPETLELHAGLALALQTEKTTVEETGLELIDSTSLDGMTPPEAIAYTKLKAFCVNIVKKLAPPLLKEVQASILRPDAEPFTPRRTTRAAK